MDKTKLILVGGFLGAGKTSMLKASAKLLKEQGMAVGLITNDQAENLVDTALLRNDGNVVREVSGSCFCCNFPGFAEAAEHVADEIGQGIILAEPVGSCTDLSATIMQPLKDRYRDLADVAPLSVLADPERLEGILDGKYSTAAYIVVKQFDEADIVLINKTDLLSAEKLDSLKKRTQERWPNAKVMAVSARTGAGINDWLDEVLNDTSAGRNLAEVDYDTYAQGEAAYGWLNADLIFKDSDEPLKAPAEKLLEILKDRFDTEGISVGHVKFLLRGKDRQWVGNITGGSVPAQLREENGFSDSIILTVNARAETGPGQLQDLVLDSVKEAFTGFTITGSSIKSLIPGRPDPTFRYKEVVD